VDLFFVLSGFLITGVLLDAKHYSLRGFFAHFYARRAQRILPPYLVLLVLASLVFGIGWTQHWYLYILLTNLLLPLHIPHPDAFTPLWSLAVEEQFYLVWPFAVYFLRRRHLQQLCVLLIVLAPVLRGSFHFHDHWPIYTLTPFRMDLLACGGFLCLLWRDRRGAIERWGTWTGIFLGTAGLLGVVLLARLGYTTGGNTRTGNVLIFESTFLVSLGTMLFALAGRGVGWLCLRPLTYIGKISYSMYLTLMGVLVLVQMRFHGVRAAAITLVLVIAYGSLSWYGMERRLLSRGKGTPIEREKRA